MYNRPFFPYLLLTIACAVSIFSCSSEGSTSNKKDKKFTPLEPAFVDEGNLILLNQKDTLARINIEIADNAAQRQRGLMYRTKLDKNAGMLFIFDGAEPQSFWMENTYIPLDILFISADLKILQISSNTIPYARKSIVCEQDAKYVLEVNGSFCSSNGITTGHQIIFEYE